MLINALFLFLRELLPIFLLVAMLMAMIPVASVRNKVVVTGLALGFVFYLVLLVFLDSLSESLAGTGLEVLFFTSACVQVVLLGLLVMALDQFQRRSVSVFLALLLALLSASGLVNYLTFYTSLWSRDSFDQPLVLGAIIGAGLSFSLSILLYFLLYSLRRWFPLMLLIMPTIFISGHFANEVNLLAQIGVIDSDVLWSTQHWLSDQMAIAQVLSGFIGYEATPIAWQVYGYLLSLTVLLTIIFVRRKNLIRALVQNEEPSS